MRRIALGTACFVAIPALAQTYSVTPVDLGPDIVAGRATDVSEDGRVVGMASVEAGRRTFGFVWKNGAVEQLVVPQPGNFSVRPRMLDIAHHVSVFAVTEAGIYGGTGANLDFGLNMQPYFAWLPHPDPYPPQYVASENMGNTIVHDLADSTPFITAVGSGSLTGNQRIGFISLLSKEDDVGDPPRVTFLPGFGGPSSPSGAWGVNKSGDVVGFAANAAGFHRPFLRPAATGVMTDLGTLGGPGGDAFAISDSGYVVGQADVAPGRPHAFMRAPGVATLFDLGTLGGPASAAHGVNDAGLCVGESWTSDGLVHAFLAQGGQMIDLNARIPAGSGWVLTHGAAINNNGWIVGWGRFDGKTRGFLLIPDGPCYPDCNADGQLTVADFGCFQTKFVAADPYADCNADGQLTVADFGCFQTAFVIGCP